MERLYYFAKEESSNKETAKKVAKVAAVAAGAGLAGYATYKYGGQIFDTVTGKIKSIPARLKPVNKYPALEKHILTKATEEMNKPYNELSEATKKLVDARYHQIEAARGIEKAKEIDRIVRETPIELRAKYPISKLKLPLSAAAALTGGTLTYKGIKGNKKEGK